LCGDLTHPNYPVRQFALHLCYTGVNNYPECTGPPGKINIYQRSKTS